MSTTAESPANTAEARVATEAGARYLDQLCKHFGHKVPAVQEGGIGRIEFPFGVVSLHTEPGALVMRVDSADAEALARGRQVMESHLLRFAFREELAVAWQSPAPG